MILNILVQNRDGLGSISIINNILRHLIIENKLLTKNKEIELMTRLFTKIEYNKYKDLNGILTELASNKDLEALEELTKLNVFKISCDVDNWLYKLIRQDMDIDRIIKYLVNIHDNIKLSPDFMNIIFDIYSKTVGYLSLCDNMLKLIDRFILLNSNTFDFINCKDVNGKTIIDRLKSINHERALNIINNVDTALIPINK